MQSTTELPLKLVVPFAETGIKNTIPALPGAIGAASLEKGFPSETFTDPEMGGIPPAGEDMNGILHRLAAVCRWANAGAGYVYDAAFANDTHVLGYPMGSRLLRTDGKGYWLNTIEGNTNDPEGATPAGWVPDTTNGIADIAMTNANVTLTPLQYGKPIIRISGALTANLNLIFPAIAGKWIVINNCTGAFTINCKTASGTGVSIKQQAYLMGDAANIKFADTDAASRAGELVAVSTGGTADAITAVFSPAPRAPSDGVILSVRATAANLTANPTFTPNVGVIAPTVIAKINNAPLSIGDIPGAGAWMILAWSNSLTKWVLLNPARGNSAGLFAIEEIITSAATLTVNDSGKSFICNSASAFAITLPLASTCPSGARISFSNIAAGRVTIQRQGADSLNNGVSVTSIVMGLTGTIVVECSSTNQWYVVGRSGLSGGDAYNDVTASRVIGATYTNTTGRPLFVTVSVRNLVASTTAFDVNFYVSGVVVDYQKDTAGAAVAATALSVSAIVPPGGAYAIVASGASLVAWSELVI